MYPDQIECPDPSCSSVADNIGDDTRGRHYYFCAECGGEWLFSFDAPELQHTPAETE